MSTVEGPQVIKFEQVPGLGHQMSLAGRVGRDWWVPVYRGATNPDFLWLATESHTVGERPVRI